jgi:hypothetical protein
MASRCLNILHAVETNSIVLPLESSTVQQGAAGTHGWRESHVVALKALPGHVATVAATGTRYVPDEHPVRTQPVAALAALRRQDHPTAVGAGDQITYAGHGVRVRRLAAQATPLE